MREGARSHQVLCPGSGFARGGGVKGKEGGSGPEETGSRALGARAVERRALCPLSRGPDRGQGQAAARAGRGARPVPPPRDESGPGRGRKRPPPPRRPQRTAPAPACGPPPHRPTRGLLPPSRVSGEGARPRRRRRRWRQGRLPPRGRETAVSLAPRHPPPPAANPHPDWGEGDANYPGSGSARPPSPRPGPACTRPRIPGLAGEARPLRPPPSPGSTGWVTPPPPDRGRGPRRGGLGTVTQPGREGPRGGKGAGPRAAQPEAGDRHRPPARGA